MTQRILRGDAPAVAQVTRLSSQATGNIQLRMNGKTGVAVEIWDAAAIASAWNASPLPEFSEVSATADGDDVVLTADTAGVPFALEGLVNGEPLADDEQLVTISPAGVGGTFPLGFDGQTTSAIAAGATASTVQAALVALGNLGPDDVQVTGPAGGPWRVRYTGARADTDQPQMTTDRINLTGGDASVTVTTLQDGNSGTESPLLVTEVVAGVAGVNEQRLNRLTADPGVALSAITLKWLVNGTHASATFPADASLATMKARLGAIVLGPLGLPIGEENLSLTGTLANSWSDPDDGVLLEFVGSLGSRNETSSYALVRHAGAAASLAETTVQNGAAGTNEVQSLQLTADPFGPGYRLKLGDAITELIAWDDALLTISAKLNAVLGSGATTGRPGPSESVETYDPTEILLLTTYGGDGVLFLEFRGAGYQSTDLPLLEVIGVGNQEIQQVAISPDAWKGQVTLTLDGETAAALDWDATAAEAESAVEALPNVGAGNVTCIGGPWPASPITFLFDEALDDLVPMTATHTLSNAAIAITTLQHGGAAVVVVEEQRSRGPLHWDDPLNWSDGEGNPGVPGSGDVVTLDSAATELLYGLQQRCEFVANAATNRLTLSSGRATFLEGQALRVRSATTLPAGLSAGTTYYAVNVDGATLQLATTPSGDAVDISDAGTGTHEVGVLLAELYLDSTFSQALGLPRQNPLLYDEYRPQSLTLWATEIEVGGGQGSGSNRIRLDTGLMPTTLEVIQTGGSVNPGVPALLWQGIHAGNVVENVAGDVGVGFYAEDAATLASLVQRGGNLVLGRNVTVAKVRRTGGTFASLRASGINELTL